MSMGQRRFFEWGFGETVEDTVMVLPSSPSRWVDLLDPNRFTDVVGRGHVAAEQHLATACGNFSDERSLEDPS